MSKSDEWKDLDNVNDYKDLVAKAKEVWRARVKNGSYGNEKIQFKACETWFSDKCNEINLWTYWHGHGLTDFSNVKIMLVGQDWGNEDNEEDAVSRIKEMLENKRELYYDKADKNNGKKLRNPTEQHLCELFSCLEKKPGEKYDLSEYNSQLFFTNYFLGYRSGSGTGNMTKKLLEEDKPAFEKLVDIVRPKVIICLGKIVSEMVIGSTIKGFKNKLDAGVITANYPKHNDIKVYCVGHCGRRGVSNRGGLAKMKKDWENINEDMKRAN
ncbi:MAG: hypothetical protein J1E64_09320 [Acetatifactor sp.]|nr:hypothetical protein [Acetatifactor sp.]